MVKCANEKCSRTIGEEEKFCRFHLAENQTKKVEVVEAILKYGNKFVGVGLSLLLVVISKGKIKPKV